MIAACFGLRKQGCGFFLTSEARTSEHDNGVFDAVRLLFQIGLEHLQLKAYAARLTAQQELGVSEGKARGVRFKLVASVGMGLKYSPGVSETGGVQVVSLVGHSSIVKQFSGVDR